jgi:plastocyanin
MGPSRVVLAVATLLAGGVACGEDPADERVVQVDFRHDEFASHYWRFFPSSIAVHPGETITFRQQWTGEPHTVTMGTLVERGLAEGATIEEKYKDLDENSDPKLLEQAESEYAAATKGVPNINPYAGTDKNQNGMQPCYLTTGEPPAEPQTACATSQQRQPAFNGRQSFYNSGFIPFSGEDGNRFRVKLADDIGPGTYRFICLLHMPQMQGAIVVKPDSSKLPSVGARNRATENEIETLAKPLRSAYRSVQRGSAKSGDVTLRPPIAGYHGGEEFTVAVDEFVPRTIKAKVGAPVKWTIVGAHTISFDVPKYVPIFTKARDGTVQRNPEVDQPVGGSPPIPPIDFSSGPVEIDGGTWDGSGFISSGLLGSEPYSTYALRFSKPGTYNYACLVHPPMVGKVVVSR